MQPDRQQAPDAGDPESLRFINPLSEEAMMVIHRRFMEQEEEPPRVLDRGHRY